MNTYGLPFSVSASDIEAAHGGDATPAEIIEMDKEEERQRIASMSPGMRKYYEDMGEIAPEED